MSAIGNFMGMLSVIENTLGGSLFEDIMDEQSKEVLSNLKEIAARDTAKENNEPYLYYRCYGISKNSKGLYGRIVIKQYQPTVAGYYVKSGKWYMIQEISGSLPARR